MTEAFRVTAFLDASVLYPALLRNILMHLALRDLFQARWSAEVHEEWMRAVLRDRPDLTRVQLERTRELMEANLDDALVTGYEPLVDTITLPDPDDRHVLAAAIHAQANVIVIANLRDFPDATLSFYAIRALHPDAFICGLFDSSPDEVVAALRELRSDLRKPAHSAADLLATMARQGLAASAKALSTCIEAV